MQAPTSTGATAKIHQGLELVGDAGSDSGRDACDSGAGTAGSGCRGVFAEKRRARGTFPAVVRALWRAEGAAEYVRAASARLERSSGTLCSAGRAKPRTATPVGTTGSADAGAAGSAAAGVAGAGAVAAGSEAGGVTDCGAAGAAVVATSSVVASGCGAGLSATGRGGRNASGSTYP
jgi:hypothetical protein